MIDAQVVTMVDVSSVFVCLVGLKGITVGRDQACMLSLAEDAPQQLPSTCRLLLVLCRTAGACRRGGGSLHPPSNPQTLHQNRTLLLKVHAKGIESINR
jgi:hypothetical protein